MTNIGEQLAGIAALVVGVATISVLVSPKANTTGVIQAAASGFGNVLAVATGPVTGSGGTPNLSYPTASGFGDLGNFSVNGLT